MLEEQPGAPPLMRAFHRGGRTTSALLIGPEGGWTDAERERSSPRRRMDRGIARAYRPARRDGGLRGAGGGCADVPLQLRRLVPFLPDDH